jgi:predicted transcriptional regulator
MSKDDIGRIVSSFCFAGGPRRRRFTKIQLDDPRDDALYSGRASWRGKSLIAIEADIGSNTEDSNAEAIIMSEAEDKALVAQILSSYLSNNTVAPVDLPSVIAAVKKAFGGGVAEETIAADGEAKQWRPAVPVKKSVSADAIICLCCGDAFKSLKRHLQAEHKLTPDEYRTAFDLKGDYPIVAPNYAAQRSALAKSLGLGRKPAEKKAASPAKKRSAPMRRAAAEA